ncbi:MAG: hypothetical protein ACFFAH_10405 [Promethearchaeota archaeon]
MTIENYYVNHLLKDISIAKTNKFFENFSSFDSKNVFSGESLDFELKDRIHNKKIPPILELAKQKDAKEIVKIYRNLYYGTYPYREMEDELEVKKMIKNPSIQWIIFKAPSRRIVGCITFILDFFNKKGYIRGFMLKKMYQGRIDVVKAMIGSMIGMCCSFKDKILSWYVENRTAHTSSQYPMYKCGIEPIGFYPNKDVFLGKVESDLMQIAYDARALNGFRLKKIPQIIPEAQNCFKYSNERYNLGSVKVKFPKLKINREDVNNFQDKLTKDITTDQFGYHYVKLFIPGTDSYFKFLYTPQIQNFEKVEYKVENLEELFVYVQDFKRLASLLKIRYYEAFISAYKSDHQAMFYNAGLIPRGYVPSWNFNKEKNKLEDYILFNWFEGSISKDIKLIDEAKKLLTYLKL